MKKNEKMTKRILSALLASSMLVASAPAALAADYVTRGQVADMLLSAADDYNTGIKRTDIIKGYPDGQLREGNSITRAEALVMLSRAFGTLPAPKGDNARSGYSASNFTDVPAWAQTELKNVFDTGIVAGTSATSFSPCINVTDEQMDLFINRVYALEGTNLKDDFYATTNKTALDNSVIKPGYSGAGSFNDLSETVNNEVADIIKTIAAAPKTADEKKIAALYNNILNTAARDAAGIAPIQPYLTAIDKASTLDDLMKVCQTIYWDTGSSALLGFGISVDSKDSSAYSLQFTSISAGLGQAGYSGATDQQKSAYLTYLATLLTLVGQDSTAAAAQAQTVWNAEAEIASHSLQTQELADVDKTYNVYTMAQLQALFPNVDLPSFFALTGLKQTDKIIVSDVGALKADATLFDDAHLPLLKTFCRLALASSFGACLNQSFTDAGNQFNQAYAGISGALSTEETAAQYVQSLMSDYLGEAYVSRYFSATEKANVEKMVADIIGIYKERIGKLTWMSDATKKLAVRKLDTMKIKIGYPDQWKKYLSNASIKTVADGGSFYDNVVQIQKAYNAQFPQWQKDGPDKDEFGMPAYTINAQYNPSNNSIEFPAGILQPPFYDANAPYAQNLGRIGYVIAHEITHAFDNNGAKYDENGNAADWWTAADYTAFQALCQNVVSLYNGRESAPGITCNGTLTLSENIADLGAMACITELEGRQSTPDYKTLYSAAAQIWCSSYSREMRQYLAQIDVHAPDKLRGSLVLQQFQQFYDAFDIQKGDGMYLAPESRVTIW